MILQFSKITRTLIVIFTIILFGKSCWGQQLHHLKIHELIDRQLVSLDHSEKFSKLQVQDFQGRIKPIHTQALELLRKVYGKNGFKYNDENGETQEISATQVFLGMQFKPDSWQLLPLIKIEKKTRDTLSKLFDINARGLVKPAQFFDFAGQYKLKSLVADAYAKAQGKRNILDKDIIKIDERINIVWGIFNGQFLKIFPHAAGENKKWHAPRDQEATFQKEDQLLFDKIILTYFEQLEQAIDTNNWNATNETLTLLNQFQKRHAGSLLLSDQKVNWELFYNKKHIFFTCMLLYTIIGCLLLIISFINVFFNEKWMIYAVKIGIYLVLIVFIYHGFGIGLRWYISGHAPWSNGYEATVFISWVGVLAGLLFSKKTTFPAAAMALIAVCLLGIAHGNLMSPEVTNLVPVLKSYWLMIHVAIITGSYGFLALGSLLAFLVLVCMAVITPNNKSKIRSTIVELTLINERTTTIGLYMFTIGTFLGGVWANESWGRYWGWDPKETWALISIVIYAFVLHIRIIFPKKNLFTYNFFSLFALSSLIMTFFGVNYYLSGLHSYAKGDAFPIPSWIFIVTPILLLLSSIARYRWKNNNIEIYSADYKTT